MRCTAGLLWDTTARVGPCAAWEASAWAGHQCIQAPGELRVVWLFWVAQCHCVAVRW